MAQNIFIYYVQLYTHSVEGERNAWREKNGRKSDETKRLTYVISYLISLYFCLSFGFIITRILVHHHVLNKQRERGRPQTTEGQGVWVCVCVVELLLGYWSSAHFRYTHERRGIFLLLAQTQTKIVGRLRTTMLIHKELIPTSLNIMCILCGCWSVFVCA